MLELCRMLYLLFAAGVFMFRKRLVGVKDASANTSSDAIKQWLHHAVHTEFTLMTLLLLLLKTKSTIVICHI